MSCYTYKRKVEVSKPGTNPFKKSGRATLMQSVLKALSTIIACHDSEPTVAHRLMLITRLADAMLGMIAKSPEEADEAKITVSPLLVAVQMAKLVIRRTKGLVVTKSLQDDACRLIRGISEAGAEALQSALNEENTFKSWPKMKIDRATDQHSMRVRTKTRWTPPREAPAHKTPSAPGSGGSSTTPLSSVSTSPGSCPPYPSTPPARPSPLSHPSPSTAPSPPSPPPTPHPLNSSSSPWSSWESVEREKGKAHGPQQVGRQRKHRPRCVPVSPGVLVVPRRRPSARVDPRGSNLIGSGVVCK